MRSLIVLSVSLCLALKPAFGQEAACVETPGKKFCAGEEIYAPDAKGLYVPGKIKTVDASGKSILEDGREVSGDQLVALSREECKSVVSGKLPPTEMGEDPAGGTNPWMNKYDPKNLRACPGDRVSDDVNTGTVIGFFGDGALLMAGEGTLPRRVEKDAFKQYAELNRLDDKRDLFESMSGLVKINKVLAITQAAATPCEAEPKPLAAPIAEKQADCPLVDRPPSIETSPRKAYFEKLLAKGTKAPLSDFLELWFPEHDGAELESPFFACEAGEGAAFKMPANGTKYFDRDCRPDTVYSWGPRAKLDAVSKNLGDGAEWQGQINSKGMAKGGVFTSISAASTFGYGSVLVRYKIKPSVDLKQGHLYEDDSPKFTARKDEYHDFVIHDGSAVESWSTGTPEIYDEVVRDMRRFRDKKRASVYVDRWVERTNYDYEKREYVSKPRDVKREGLTTLFKQGADGYKMAELTLKQNLLELIRQILAGEGRVSYAKGACRNRARHYATEHPNYINPFPLAVKAVK